MSNVISLRVADFLKNYPPFNFIHKKRLQEISLQIKVLYFEKGDEIFKQDKNTKDIFYMVKDGAVGLYRNENKIAKLVDINDEGDIFGLRPIISKENYHLSAIAEEETILYGIPISVFKMNLEKNKKVQDYLLSSFASNTNNPKVLSNTDSLLTTLVDEAKDNLWELQPVKFTKKVISCSPETTIENMAKTMSKKDIGSMVIAENNIPVGIITDSDLRNKIATGEFSIETKAKDIMSSPIITQPPSVTVSQAQMIMVKYNIKHLCITEDGTINTIIVGFLSEHDILVSKASNPSALIKEIKRSKKVRQLREIKNKSTELLKGYLEQDLRLTHISKIISEINDALTIRCIELAQKKIDKKTPVKFTWIALGSQGRHEQLLPTDQDNALIFEDVPKEQYEDVKKYFLELSTIITKHLHKIGFEYCPADMMGSNPKWCLSLSEWKNQFEQWILKPNEEAILLASIFFDFNFIYGEKSFTTELSETIFGALSTNSILYKYLGKEILSKPSPLGFFRQFLVEQNGENKDFFDIKSRAMMPLIDAARILTLSNKVIDINNTSLRYEKLAVLEPQNKELYLSCSIAFKILSKFRTTQGIMHNDSGRYIEIESLTKEDKLKLKKAFKPIKEIQETLALRFSLSNFS